MDDLSFSLHGSTSFGKKLSMHGRWRIPAGTNAEERDAMRQERRGLVRRNGSPADDVNAIYALRLPLCLTMTVPCSIRSLGEQQHGEVHDVGSFPT